MNNEELLQQLTTVIKQEVGTLRNEFYDFKTETKNNFSRIDKKIDTLRNDFEDFKQETNSKFFLMESELVKKVDIIYDFVTLQRDLVEIKFNDLRNLDERMGINEIRVLDHENRLYHIEMKDFKLN